MKRVIRPVTLMFTFLLTTGAITAQAERKKPAPTVVVISCGVCNTKALFLPQPVYPEVARAVKAVGSVSVTIKINEKGKVYRAKAVDGHIFLRSASEKAALQSRFEPFTLSNGKRVRGIGTIVYNFRR